MSKNRTSLYLGLAAAGAGGYYLYRAGGDPKVAKEELKHDANLARGKVPTTEQVEKEVEKAGSETKLNIDEAAKKASTKAKDAASEGMRKAEDEASKLQSEVEAKASEAKGTVSGWFGGKK